MAMLIILRCHNYELLLPMYDFPFYCMNWFFLTKKEKKIPLFTLVGKSTTTSMLAYVLEAMGDDLTAVIGAQVPQVL